MVARCNREILLVALLILRFSEPAEKRPKVDGPAAAAPIGMPNLSAPPPMIPQVVAGPFQSGQQALGKIFECSCPLRA